MWAQLWHIQCNALFETTNSIDYSVFILSITQQIEIGRSFEQLNKTYIFSASVLHIRPINSYRTIKRREFDAEKKGFWIAVVVIALVGIGGYFIYTTQTAEADSAETSNAVQTSPVRQGDITISATGAGTVIPATEIDVSFQSSGILQELLVRVGDEVVAGDVLARLDDTDAQHAVVSAELQLAQAIMQTESDATAAGVSYNDIAIEQARLNLEDAQAALAELRNWEPDEDEIALAEAAVAAAQAGYNAALGQESASYNSIQVQAINLEQAQRDLEDAQAAYDTAYDPARDWELVDSRTADRFEAERDAAVRNLQRAQDNLDIAQANYNSTVSSSNSSSPKMPKTMS